MTDINSAKISRTGASGETLAADYLSSIGYAILARNYRAARGEIDIVAECAGGIVFAEVKARAYVSASRARDDVTPAKQARIIRVAEAFLVENDMQDRFVRFDVLEVYADRIVHVRRAFDA